MTSWITSALAGALVAFGALAQDGPVVIGASVAETGALADLGAHYRKGLLLWEEQANAAGGLLGRRVVLRLIDDGSDSIRVGSLYRRLVQQDKVDLLIGPYGSAAALMAGAEAETGRVVMVNGGGRSRAVHKRLPRFVFQSVAPYPAYARGVLELAKQAGYNKLLLVARDDPASREMGEGAREAAQKLGLQSGDLEVYSPGASDFTLLVAKARASGIEAWIAFAEGREPAEMVKNLKRLDYTPRLFFARSAQGPGFIQLVGQDAEFALSAQPYAPSFASPANSAFVKAYRAKWSAEPTVEAAEGYVAATVLAEAVRRAGSLERDKLRAALAALDMETVLGPYRVDPATGEQTAMAPAVLQIQKGRAQVVWPEPLQTGKAILPYPLWHERQVLRGGRR